MIDLKNPEARKGAMAALKILIKSKDGPIEVIGGKGSGSSNGPQLTPPKNVKEVPPEEQGQGKEQDKDQQNQDQEQGNGESSIKKIADSNDQNKEDGSGSSDGGEKQDGSQSDKKSKGNNGKDSKDSAEKTDDTEGQGGGHKDEFTNAEENAELLAKIKADAQYKLEKQKEQEDDALRNATAGSRKGNYEEFINDLYYMIANQVRMSKNTVDSYKRGYNPSYAGSNLLMPKSLRTQKREIPVIYVFFDQSGSFGAREIQQGKNALAALQEFVDRGDIAEPKIFYFADKCSEKNSNLGSSTEGFPQCLAVIKAAQELPIGERCNNVIVISDHDIETQSEWGRSFNGHTGWDERVEVDGHVFWCWAGDRGASPTAVEYLTGQMGSTQYKI